MRPYRGEEAETDLFLGTLSLSLSLSLSPLGISVGRKRGSQISSIEIHGRNKTLLPSPFPPPLRQETPSPLPTLGDTEKGGGGGRARVRD